MIYVAPLQGFTEAPFRNSHAAIYGETDTYFSPFLRIEHCEVRKRDLRDIESNLNRNHHLIPQIIFRDIDEFRILTNKIMGIGYKEIDMNLGCPFPPQVNRGRGSGTISNKQLLERIAHEISNLPSVTFSLKMRLGVKNADESKQIADIINTMPLSHVTIHPRIATQQYKGSLLLNDFLELSSMLKHRIIFNGDILTPGDIDSVLERYPFLTGVMIGRGLLARPSLISEWREKRIWSREERRLKLLEFHSKIFNYYANVLCGDSQILSKIKPFWEYLELEIGSKIAKNIKKSTTCSAYLSAVKQLEFD